jgi:ribonuclease D
MNLYRWRFQKAKETNRARFRVLSDQILVDLAITEASTIEMLELTGILTPEKISLYGREIIKAVLENKQSQQAL